MPALPLPELEPPHILRLWTELEADSPPAKPETLRPTQVYDRINRPASHFWPLSDVLKRLKSAWPDSRKKSTWDQYTTLLRYWERFFGNPGPCVSALASADLQDFFESVEEWGTQRSWQRNSDQLTALLKSACRQSQMNREGLPRDVDAPLRIDDLPFVTMPSTGWFSSNRTAGASRSGGHTPKRRSTVTLDQFQKVIDAIWSNSLALDDRVWWETMFAWIWFSGMRITQAREGLPWCFDGVSDGIDLNSHSLVTTDSKCNGAIEIPLPECLRPGFQTLWHRHKPDTFRGKVFFGPGHQSANRFYVWWDRIWQHAIPCDNDAERELRHFNPHELRAVSTTNWDLRPSPDNKAGYLITGHRAGDVRSAAYFTPGDARLREIVNRFPMPRLRSPKPLFV